MRIKIPSRRLARRSIGLLLTIVLVSTPAVVLASHQFHDVPASNPFHSDIDAIAEAGITAGFPDGGYHPSEPVTRQAMAAFMHRGFGRVGLAIGTLPITSSVSAAVGDLGSSGAVPVRELTIVVPGATNAYGPQQFVHLHGNIHFFTSMSTSDKGCPCEFAAFIRDTTTGLQSHTQYQTFESTSSGGSFYYNFDVVALFAAPPGTRTYRLEVALTYRDSGANAAAFSLDHRSHLGATTFPFGPAGTDSLSSTGAQNVGLDVDQLPERRRDE